MVRSVMSCSASTRRRLRISPPYKKLIPLPVCRRSRTSFHSGRESSPWTWTRFALVRESASTLSQAISFPSRMIAALVQFVEMFLKKAMPPLYQSLGVYLPLIVVNCIILGRAEMFASKNNILDSALDGIGMGIGFTLTLTVMGSIREIIGSGTWMAGLGKLIPALGADFKVQIIPEGVDTFSLMTSAPGGFFVFGILMAGATWLTTRPKKSAPAVEGGNA